MIIAGFISLVAAIFVASEVLIGVFGKKWDYDCRTADGSGPVDALEKRRYFSEWRYAQTQFIWHPFCYWRSAPRRGSYINVDGAGLRSTPTPRTEPLPAAAERIFFFGGSTMWGAGVRDEATIATQCLAALRDQGNDVEIINYGQIGYVSTQSMIALLQALQRGDIPTAVVFYDGYNDVMSAATNGIAGIGYNEARRVAEFNLMTKPFGLAKSAVRATRTVGLLLGAWQRRPARQHPQNMIELSEAIVSNYLANLRSVTALGKEFGFTPLFYWQPTIFRKASLTHFEASQRSKIADFEQLFDIVEGRLRAIARTGQAGPTMLTNILQEQAAPLFLDWAHLSEAGNGLIAERIGSDLASWLELKPHFPSAGYQRDFSDDTHRSREAL